MGFQHQPLGCAKLALPDNGHGAIAAVFMHAEVWVALIPSIVQVAFPAAGVKAIGTRNTWVFGCLLVGVTVGDTLRKSSYFGRLRVAVGKQ